MDELKNKHIHVWNVDELDDLFRKIDWNQYKVDLQQSLANERLWELGCFDGDNPHTENIKRIEEELNLLEAGEYEEVIKMHDLEHFKDFVEE